MGEKTMNLMDALNLALGTPDINVKVLHKVLYALVDRECLQNVTIELDSEELVSSRDGAPTKKASTAVPHAQSTPLNATVLRPDGGSESLCANSSTGPSATASILQPILIAETQTVPVSDESGQPTESILQRLHIEIESNIFEKFASLQQQLNSQTKALQELVNDFHRTEHELGTRFAIMEDRAASYEEYLQILKLKADDGTVEKLLSNQEQLAEKVCDAWKVLKRVQDANAGTSNMLSQIYSKVNLLTGNTSDLADEPSPVADEPSPVAAKAKMIKIIFNAVAAISIAALELFYK